MALQAGHSYSFTASVEEAVSHSWYGARSDVMVLERRLRDRYWVWKASGESMTTTRRH